MYYLILQKGEDAVFCARERLKIKNFQPLIENAAYAAECEDNYASILEVFCNALKKRDAV